MTNKVLKVKLESVSQNESESASEPFNEEIPQIQEIAKTISSISCKSERDFYIYNKSI